MSAKKTKDISRALLGKGFGEVDTHHEMYWLYVDGKKTQIRTRLSHSMNEYDDNLLGLMARQLKVSRGELDDLVDCPLSKEKYAALMLERGHVRRSESRPEK